MLRLAALALLGLALAAGCAGKSERFTEGEGGEASGAESSGGASGTRASGVAGNATGGVASASGASAVAFGGSNAGVTGAGGTDTGGGDAGGADSGGNDTGGTDSGGSDTGGAAGAFTTHPSCPVREPASRTDCSAPFISCPYDTSGCLCLLVQSDRCLQLDATCFAVDMGDADRIAAPPVHYCHCRVADANSTWSCAHLNKTRLVVARLAAALALPLACGGSSEFSSGERQPIRS